MCTSSFLLNNYCYASCPPGYWDNPGGGYPICTACDSSCLECNAAGPNACTKCAADTSFLHSIDNSCMATCPNGYYGNANAGNPICTLCDSTCLWCDGGAINSCTKCPVVTATTVARYLHNKKCLLVCPDGLWENNNSDVPICTDCHAECLHCSGGTNTDCTKCFEGTRWLLSGTCHSPTCPTEYWTDDNDGAGNDGTGPICKLCTSINARCKECHASDGLTCTLCTAGDGTGLLHEAGTTGATCLTSCPADLWFPLSNVCYACHASCK